MVDLDNEIEHQRRANVKLFRKDHPLGEDIQVNTEINHSVDMIMLGYIEYVPTSKLLKVTTAGEARFRLAEKQRKKQRAHQATH